MTDLGEDEKLHRIRTREGANGAGWGTCMFLLGRRVVMMATAWETGTAITVWTRVRLPSAHLYQNAKQRSAPQT